jgi:transposase
MGASGRRVIEAMIAGERNARRLAALTGRQVKASPKQLYDALHGRLTDNHRFLLRLHLEQYDALAQAVAKIDSEVEARLPEQKEGGGGSGDQNDVRFLSGLIDAIPGLNWLGSLSVLSEIGVDMSRFASAGRLIAWAGLCPAQNESAGKRRSGRLRKGAPWLKTMLVQCAWAAVRAKKSYFCAKFHRLKARCGPQKAICAVAASILNAIYHVIARKTPFVDLGVDHFEKRHPQKKLARLLRQIKALGYKADIQLTPNAA